MRPSVLERRERRHEGGLVAVFEQLEKRVCKHALSLLDAQGVAWTASGEAVLSNSLGKGAALPSRRPATAPPIRSWRHPDRLGLRRGVDRWGGW